MKKTTQLIIFSAAALALGATEPALEIVATSTNLVVTEQVQVSLVLRLPPVPGAYADAQAPFINKRPPHVTCPFLEGEWKDDSIDRVELKNINPPTEIEEVMTKQMRAERERRQTVLEARAHQESVVSRAEGDKQAKVLAAQAEKEAKIALAQGEAESIRLVYEAQAEGLKKLREAKIDASVLKLKGLEALRDVADGRATKIYMPTDLADSIASIGVIGEALGIGDHTSIDTSEREAKALENDPCIHGDTSTEGKRAATTNAQIRADLEARRNNVL